MLTAVSTYFLCVRTSFLTALKLPETLELLLEILILAGVLFACTGIKAKKKRTGCFLAVCAGFLWIHQVFLPVLTAGLYLGYLNLLGETVLELCRGKTVSCRKDTENSRTALPEKERGITENSGLQGIRGLLLGAALQLIISAVLALAGIGGAGTLRVQVLLSGLGLLALSVTGKSRRQSRAPDQRKRSGSDERSVTDWNAPGALLSGFLIAVITAGLLMQAGRMNIALDYDSLHYGLRSAFVLDTGAGFYQNQGSVNDVYVYPKGLEILCLPLSGLCSGSFVTAVSWWLGAGVLWIVKYMTEQPDSTGTGAGGYGNKSLRGLLAMLFVCAVPGVMNMTVSAKTDMATLFFQLAAAAEFTAAFSLYQKEELPGTGEGKRRRTEGLLCALAAAVFTLVLKPTSYLFSFLLVLAAAGTLLLQNKKRYPGIAGSGHCDESRVRQEINHGRVSGKEVKKETVLLLAAAVLAAVLVTLRTVLFAGVPLTTAGRSLWYFLGFELKYPFAGLEAAGNEGTNVLKRLIGVFLCPVGEEMSHVYIAWGGLVPAVCLMAAALQQFMGLFHQKESKQSGGTCKAEIFFLRFSLLLVLAASLGCIAVLYQVDGNYFMLLYVLSILNLFACGERERIAAVMVLPVFLGLAVCTVTNWAGVTGLSRPGLWHAGYENQAEEDRLVCRGKGTEELYDFLAEDPRVRVFAMAEQPACFVYRCNVQSYTDLEGSGGNVALVKTLADFKAFLNYAQEDYLLTEDSFLAAHSRAAQIVAYMLEDGSLEEIWSGGENRLYKYFPEQK